MIPFIRGLFARIDFVRHDGRVEVAVNKTRIQMQFCVAAANDFVFEWPETAREIEAIVVDQIRDAALKQTGCLIPRWRLRMSTWP